MNKYYSSLTFSRAVLINPDGSSFLINITTEYDYLYGFASMNMFCQLYASYLPHYMKYPDMHWLDDYNVSMSLPWVDDTADNVSS